MRELKSPLPILTFLVQIRRDQHRSVALAHRIGLSAPPSMGLSFQWGPAVKLKKTLKTKNVTISRVASFDTYLLFVFYASLFHRLGRKTRNVQANKQQEIEK